MGNSVVVTDPDGTRVDDGSVQPSGSTALVGVKALTTTGIYTVAYQLFLADGQNLSGTYTFNFTGSTAPTSTPTSASPTPTKTFPPLQQHSTFFDRLKGGGIGLLLIALVLIVIGSRFAASRSNRD